MKGRRAVAAVVALGYLVFMFVIAVRADRGSSLLGSAGGLAFAAAVHLLVGLAIARWWAVALPAAAIASAALLGHPQSPADAEVPVWVGFAFRAPVLLAAMLVGVCVGVAVSRSRQRASAHEADY